MNNKRLIIILSIFTIVFTLMGGTLAYFNWQSADNKKTNVTFTVNTNYSCSADSGGHITSSDVSLVPAKCNDPVYAIKKTIRTSVSTNDDKVVSLSLWLNINDIDSNLANSPNFKWVFTKNGNTCNGAINYGTFQNIQNNKIDLLDGAEYATLNDTYYLYIWLDEAETNNNTQNQSFDFSIGGECGSTGIIKAPLKSLNTAAFFREEDYKTKITDVHFVYDDDLPSGIQTNNVKTYDLAWNASRPITGYLVENTDQGADPDTYKVYVSSQYRIFAANLQNAFEGMSALKSVSFDNLDTSESTNMSGMFASCSSLTSLDLSSFNTSSSGNMSGMFQGCTNLASLNISSFNTSNVLGMVSMFQGCNGLATVDITGFDTSNVSDMHNMFAYSEGFTSLDLRYLNTSSVSSMSNMFRGASNLTTLDLSSFDTSSVNTMFEMFCNCSGLTSLNLSGWNTSSVTTMQNMFAGCSSLIYLDLSSFNTSSVNNMITMFSGCSNLELLDLSSFDTSSVTNMNYMFTNAGKLRTIYVSELWNTGAVTSSVMMFTNDFSLPGYTAGSTDVTKAYYGEGGYLTYKAYTPPSSGS